MAKPANDSFAGQIVASVAKAKRVDTAALAKQFGKGELAVKMLVGRLRKNGHPPQGVA